MAIQNYFAGMTPIGGDLPQVANLLQRKNTADQEMALRQRDQTLQEGVYKNAMAKDQQAQDLNAKWAEISQVEQAPPQVQEQWLQQQRQSNPEFGGHPEFAQMSAQQLIPMMKAGLAAKLGKDDDIARLKQGQSQFDARQALDREQMAASQRNSDRSYALQQQQERRLSQPQPEKPANPQLVDIPLSDGTTQKQWLRPGETQGAPVGAPIIPKTAGGLTPKDASSARMKQRQLSIARSQLALVRQKFEKLKGTFSAGPGGNLVPTVEGKAFDAAVNSMRDTLTSITRVPGIGAMSDFETRLSQAKFPDRGQYEEVGAQQIQSIDDLLSGLEQGYGDMLGTPPSAAGQQSSTAKAPQSAIDHLKAHPELKGAFKAKYGYLP